jgi:hypothetical protein
MLVAFFGSVSSEPYCSCKYMYVQTFMHPVDLAVIDRPHSVEPTRSQPCTSQFCCVLIGPAYLWLYGPLYTLEYSSQGRRAPPAAAGLDPQSSAALNFHQNRKTGPCGRFAELSLKIAGNFGSLGSGDTREWPRNSEQRSNSKLQRGSMAIDPGRRSGGCWATGAVRCGADCCGGLLREPAES